MTDGMHNHRGLFPQLPGREVDADHLDVMAAPGSEFRAAWEFVLSHELTDHEASAFWHGVNIQSQARAIDCPHRGWETRRWTRSSMPLVTGGILPVERASYDVDDQGHVIVQEALMAELLLAAGWERTT